MKKVKVPSDKLDSIIRKLYLDKPFYGYVLSRFGRVWTDIIETMAICLEDMNLKISRNYYERLTNNERVAVVSHEVLHPAFFHFLRFKKQMKEGDPLVNVAADCAINQLIPNLPVTYVVIGKIDTLFGPQPKVFFEGFERALRERGDFDPKGNYKTLHGEVISAPKKMIELRDKIESHYGPKGYYDIDLVEGGIITLKSVERMCERFCGEKVSLEPKKNAEYYYTMLKKCQKEGNGGGQGQPGNGDGDGKPIDDVIQDIIDKIIEEHKESAKGDGDKKLEENRIKRIFSKAKRLQDNQDRKAGKGKGDFMTNILPDYTIKTNSRLWKKAISRAMGVNPVAETKPVYNRPNRRIPTSVWGKKHQLISNKAFVIQDTSGSMFDPKELAQCYGHIVSAIKSEGIECELIECDDEVQQVKKLNSVPQLKNNGKGVEVKGGAGTDLRKALDYIEATGEKIGCIVVLTDGYTPWREVEGKFEVTAIYTKDHKELPGVKYSAVLEE